MVEKMHRRKESGDYIAEKGLRLHAEYATSITQNKKTTVSHKSDCDVAVILINYNSSDYTIKCINSIKSTTSKDLTYKIVVIDNASETDDFRKLADHVFANDNDIQLYRSKINLGFSAGNMMGVQNIGANYYFLLNNDCILQNDCIGILYRFCEHNQQVALCSPQLFDSSGTPIPCINYFPTLKTKIFGSGILNISYNNKHIRRKVKYSNPVQVDVVSGSQMFVRADYFFEIGGLDTIFFLYCEEEDLALRFNKAGYKTYLVPQARNYHLGSASTRKSLAIKKEFYISFLYFYRKHYGSIKCALLKFIFTLKLLRKSLKDKENFKLAIFVAAGAHLKYSLRHSQKVVPLDDLDYQKLNISSVHTNREAADRHNNSL
jgi:GT2 family glycosyltransferase